ncbi:hypothetical protein Fcan01_17579 [Folsomia candida]|uniref:YqaJ viral recombinase domain-containing protein n=1 Tax=Folsomia candida TaxID=158441 RepID=A0A226DQ24_FOLCA|nr:hypothetical protein Fcan01_17579 [Folsomia candida]
MAVKHYLQNKTNDCWKNLQHDILNIPFHIFGRHHNCESYFCDPNDSTKAVEADSVTAMMSCSFWEPLQSALRKIANESYSLMENQTSNASESFMSVANKFMEGKRKNLGQKGLYRHRMLAAVFSYNNCSFWPAKIYTTLFNKPPSSPWRRRYAVSYRERCRSKKPKAARKLVFPVPSNGRGDKNYGCNPVKPDMSEDVLAASIALLKQSLQVDIYQQQEIEQQTRDQSECLIPLMEYGKNNEENAIKAYEMVKGLIPGSVKKCGLFVDLNNGIFAASPDRVLDDDGLLEVKCPPSIRDKDPKDWPTFSPKTSCLENRDGQLRLKRSHAYYYQVIMQIYVTNRQWCDFFVWTPVGYHLERISRSNDTDKLWETMKINMEYFWDNDLAPELVDSRFDRGYTEYRCPESRKDAVAKKANKNTLAKKRNHKGHAINN